MYICNYKGEYNRRIIGAIIIYRYELFKTGNIITRRFIEIYYKMYNMLPLQKTHLGYNTHPVYKVPVYYIVLLYKQNRREGSNFTAKNTTLSVFMVIIDERAAAISAAVKCRLSYNWLSPSSFII